MAALLMVPWVTQGQILEGFEGGAIPTRWVASSGDPHWYVGSSPSHSSVAPHTGSYMLIMDGDGNDASCTITSPTLDLSSADSSRIAFWYTNPSWGSDQNVLTVKYSSDNGANWVTAGTYNTSVTTWTHVTIDIPDSANTSTFKVRFEGYDNYGYYITLDDIEIGDPPACPVPTDFAVRVSDTTSCTLAWNMGSATNFDIVYGIGSIEPDSVYLDGTNVLSSTTDSIEVAGLTSGQRYNFYLRAACTDENSFWVGPLTVRTTREHLMVVTGSDTLHNACGYIIYDDGGPDGDYSNSSNSTLVLYPTDGMYITAFGTCHFESAYWDWLKIYEGVGTTGALLWAWTGSGTGTGTIPQIYSEQGPVTLQFHSDGSGQYAGFELNVGCYTNSCPAPDSLSLVSPTPSSITATWVAGGMESEWLAEIYYNDSLVGVQDVSVSEATFTGLDTATVYTVKIYALCDAGDTSRARESALRTSCFEFLPIPYDYGFEDLASGEVPFCGTAVSYNPAYSYPYAVTTTAASGNKSLYMYTSYSMGSVGNVYTYYAVGPVDTLTNEMNTLLARLSVKDPYGYSGREYTRSIVVGLMTNPADLSTFYPVDTVYGEYGAWNEAEVYFNNIPDTLGAAYIAFVSQPIVGNTGIGRTYYNNVNIDDIHIDLAPTCYRPSGLAASMPGSNDLTLSWTENGDATGWNIVYDTVPIADSLFASYTPTPVTTNPVTISGLDPVTAYYFYVQADCGSEQSEWSSVAIGTTGFDCGDSLTYGFASVPGAATISGCPIYTSYGSSMSQTIYTAAELNEMGLYRGYIRKMKLEWTSTSSYCKRQSIYLAATAMERFTSSTSYVPVANFHQVWADSAATNTVGVKEYMFDTAFYWDGVSNLCVMFLNSYNGACTNVGAYSSSGMSARAQSVPNNTYATIYRYGDNVIVTTGNCLTFSNSSYTSNRTAWTFEGCVDVPACPAPRNVQVCDIDTASADVTWYEAGSATVWNVAVTTAPTNRPDTVSGMLHVTDTAHLSGLVTNTLYYVYVQSDCGSDTSTWSSAATFRTACGAFLIPYVEDFDGYAANERPTCWISDGSYTYPYTYAYYHHSGANSYNMYSSSTFSAPTYFISPEIDTVAHPLTSLMTSFWMYASSYNTAQYPATLVVGVMSDPTNLATFHAVDTVTAGVQSAWVERDVLFSNVDPSWNAKHIAYFSLTVNYTSSYAYNYVYLDDVVIDTIPDCMRPTSINVASQSGDTVNLFWNGSGTSYQVVYGPMGFNPDTATVNVVSGIATHAATIAGLPMAFSYDFYVRTECGSEYSDWRGPVTALISSGNYIVLPSSGHFDTTACGVIVTDNGGPTGQYSNGYDGYVTVYPDNNYYFIASGWVRQEGTIDYLQIYQGADPATGTLLYSSQSTPGGGIFGSIEIEGGEPVTIKFHSDVSVVYDGFEVALGCVSEGSCPRVNRLTDSIISATSMAVDWNDRGNTYAGYLIEYDTAAMLTGAGTIVYTTSHPYTITGLTPSTDYRWRVRAVCSAADTAAWSSSASFTTCQLPAAVPYSYDFENAAEWANWQTSSNPSSTAHWTRGTYGQPSVPGSQYGMFVTYNDSNATYQADVSNITAYRDVDFGSVDTTFTIGFDAKMGGSPLDRYDGLMVFLADPAAPVVSTDDNITTPWGNVNNLYRIADVRYDDLDGEDAWTHFEGTFDNLSGVHRVAFFWFHQGPITNFVGDMAQVDNLSITYASCPRPYNLRVANTTSSTATLAWDGPANENYSVVYRPASGTAADNVWLATPTNSATITGLTDLTEYHAWVIRYCSASDTSLVSDGIAFTTTMCDNFAEYVSYDTVATQGFTSYFPAYSYYRYGYTQTLIDSATIAASGLMVGDPIEGFEYYATTTTAGSYFDNCNVYLTPTTRTAFSGTTDWDSVTMANRHYSGDLNVTRVGWRMVRFDSTYTWDGNGIVLTVDRDHGSYSNGFLSASVSTTGIHMLYTYSDYYNFDPLTMGVPDGSNAGTPYSASVQPIIKFFNCGTNRCRMPSVTDITHDYQSGTVAWRSSATAFEVNVKALAAPEWPATATSVNGAYAHTFSGLQPATTYMYRLRAMCDSVSVSDWVEGRFVTDSLPCFAPVNLQAAAGFGSAELRWTPGTDETQWYVHVWNTTFDSTYSASVTPFTAAGLTPGTEYSAAVAAICGGGLTVSDYSGAIAFTTSTCAIPTGLSSSNVTASSAHVSWTPGANNTGSWIVEYGTEGFTSGSGTQMTVSAPSADITGLEAALTYDVYVRAVCDAAYPSGWSSKATFTTLEGAGMDNAAASHVSIFPNPAEHVATVSVTGVDGMVVITVVDMDGRPVSTATVECGVDCAKRLDLDNLPGGAYFVRIQGDGVDVVKKLVVK